MKLFDVLIVKNYNRETLPQTRIFSCIVDAFKNVQVHTYASRPDVKQKFFDQIILCHHILAERNSTNNTLYDFKATIDSLVDSLVTPK